MIFGAVFIGIVGILILFLFFRKYTVWWEYILPPVVAIVFGLGFKAIFSAVSASDVEWRTERLEQVEYYEDWNETVTYVTVVPGPNGTSTTQVHTRVDYHAPKWILIGDRGTEVRGDKQDYEKVVRQWGTEKFVDMRRVHAGNDGDKYFAKFPGARDLYDTFALTTTHKYTNKVAASSNVFDYEEVDTDEFPVIDYPKSGWSISRDHHWLSSGSPLLQDEAQRLAVFNSRWGPTKQVRVWVVKMLDENNQGLDLGYAQEAHWQGGNKNELVICYGVDSDDTVKWGHVFSWTEREDFKVGLRSMINTTQTGKPFDLNPTMDWLDENITDWDRREFAEFDYLSVPVPLWATLVTYALTMMATCGVIYWSILNEIDNMPVQNRFDYYGKNRYRKLKW